MIAIVEKKRTIPSAHEKKIREREALFPCFFDRKDEEKSGKTAFERLITIMIN